MHEGKSILPPIPYWAWGNLSEKLKSVEKSVFLLFRLRMDKCKPIEMSKIELEQLRTTVKKSSNYWLK